MHAAKSKTPFASRLKLLISGLVLAGVGLLRMAAGIEVVRHGSGQPLFSWGLIAAGLVCFVLGLIPSSWVVKASGTPSIRKHNR